MYGAHIWHSASNTIHASLHRTAHVRLHSGAPEPLEPAHRHDPDGRTYLEEDLRLIRKYFPGAQTIALRTPFDLTIAPQDPWELRADDCSQAAVGSPQAIPAP